MSEGVKSDIRILQSKFFENGGKMTPDLIVCEGLPLGIDLILEQAGVIRSWNN